MKTGHAWRKYLKRMCGGVFFPSNFSQDTGLQGCIYVNQLGWEERSEGRVPCPGSLLAQKKVGRRRWEAGFGTPGSQAT